MGGAVLMLREVAQRPYSARVESLRHDAVTAPSGPAAAADPDAVEALGDEIAVLSAHLHAATHRLLVLIARYDRLRGWEAAGYSSCADWLSVRTGVDRATAREKVRVARALQELPLTSAAMARGELSFSAVRALTRVADAETESDLLELARGATTEQLERMVRAWKKGRRADELTKERERFGARTLSIFPDDDGMYVIHGRLTPEMAALLMRAIDAASDAIYHEQRIPGVENETQREAAQRRADAIGLVAERALAAGLGAARAGELPADDRIDTPISGTRAERYQVMLHVDAATLNSDAEPGRSELEDGTRVSAETSRRLAGDASVVEVARARNGSVLDIGRRRRTVSPALRRALDVRDRGCRFPGCGRRFTDAHDVKHWAEGSETSLSNTLLLCVYHHRLVHEGGWRIEWWDDARPAFIDPRGQTHFDGRWQPPNLDDDPVGSLIIDNQRRGIVPDANVIGARWRREADIPAAIYFRANEAL